MGCSGSKKGEIKAPASAQGVSAESGVGSTSDTYTDDEFLQSLPERLKGIPELDEEERRRITDMKNQMDDAWANLDADNTGELDGEQLDSLVLWILEQFSEVVSTEEVRAETETMLHNVVHKSVDRDKDGKVSKSEFVSYFAKLAPAMMRIKKHQQALLARSSSKDAATLSEKGSGAAAESGSEAPESGPMTEKDWLAIELPEYDPDTAPELGTAEEADILCHTVRNERFLKKLAPEEELTDQREISGEHLEALVKYAWKHVHLSKQPTSMELQAELIKVLERADSNSNGALDWAEFRAYFESTAIAYARFRKQQKQNQAE